MCHVLSRSTAGVSTQYADGAQSQAAVARAARVARALARAAARGALPSLEALLNRETATHAAHMET